MKGGLWERACVIPWGYMMRGSLLAVILLLPGLALGATLEGQRTVVLSEAPADNTYLAGSRIEVRAPVPADLSAAGANIVIAAPVAGDVLVAGGTLDVERPVTGDVRAAGGRIVIAAPVAGDVAALGGVVIVSGRAHDVQVMGGTVRLTGGADGNVTIYGSDVHIAGEYLGNVSVSASDRITVAEGAHITGTLRYNAPQEATIEEGAVIEGGATYTGAASYLPSEEEAARYALAGAGVFFLVKALAALVAAGLIVGLFPQLSERMVHTTLQARPRQFVLRTLLGFALLIATPILMVLLMVSFVGIGIALILLALYLLLVMLAYVYAALLIGSAPLKALTKRTHATWKAAILGMFLLFILNLVPVIGGVVTFALMLTCAGALAAIAYRFAWRRDA